jgi:hypothetical protein
MHQSDHMIAVGIGNDFITFLTNMIWKTKPKHFLPFARMILSNMLSSMSKLLVAELSNAPHWYVRGVSDELNYSMLRSAPFSSECSPS